MRTEADLLLDGSSNKKRRQDQLEPQAPERVRHVRQREHLEPTSVWLMVGLFFLTCAAGTGIGALTATADSAARPSEFWIATVAFVALAATCFIAQWDTNRGRKSREYVIEAVLSDGDD